MGFEARSDLRRWRLLFAAAALLLLSALGTAIASSGLAWRAVQDDFRRTSGASRSLGLREVETCGGEVERCTSCHLGEVESLAAGGEPRQPFGAHGPVLEQHSGLRIGCSDCHGGIGRSLDSRSAHLLAGSEARDPLMGSEHVEASCGRCHVPGDAPGMERLVRGSALYGELGCAVCHPLGPEGRGGGDFGPNLRAGARWTLERLEQSLMDPAADFPGTTMPSFHARFAGRPEELKALLVFVESLRLDSPSDCSRLARSAGLAERRCSSCHAGERGAAGGRFAHRCVALRERATELSCARCHQQLPAGDGECPVVAEHRGGCAVCHREEGVR